jgi:pimeloyl-ACP methyl ester carboxylesterase
MNRRKFLFLLPIIWCLVSPACMRMRTTDKKALITFADQGVTTNIATWTNQTGRHIHYVETGADSLPILLLVHGSPGSWDAWKDYLSDADLRQRFHLIAVDRPGFGYSDFGKAMDLDGNTDILLDFLQSKSGGRPSFLMGHSIGGPIVMRMAQKNAAAVRGLVILAGSISPTDEPKERWRKLFPSPIDYLLPGAMRPSNREIVYFKKDLWTLDAGYAAVTMPVWFVHGQKDMLVTIKNVAYGLKKLDHNAQVKQTIFPEENHFIPWTQFDEVKKLLLGVGI